MPVLRKRRVIRDRIFQAPSAKPTIRKVEVHFFAQPTLRANPEAVAHDQHADQQYRVNRRTARVAVVRGQMRMQFAQIEKLIDTTKQMICGNVIVKIEGVEQGGLCSLLTSHHRENLARSMGDQSTTSITPRQGCFSTESIDFCRSSVTRLINIAQRSDRRRSVA